LFFFFFFFFMSIYILYSPNISYEYFIYYSDPIIDFLSLTDSII